MEKKKLIDAISIIFMFLGFFLAYSPHLTHISAGHTADHTHVREIAIGLVVGIASLMVLVYNNRKNSKK